MTRLQTTILAPLMILVATATALPAQAAGTVVLDYRKTTTQTLSRYAPALRSAIAASLDADAKAALGDTFVILGDARGRFAAGAPDQRAYLLAREAPIASVPFPEKAAQFVAIVAGGKVVVLHRLPAERLYARLAAAHDVDRDGTAELLLQSEAYNMGQSTTTLDLIKLGPNGGAALRQALGPVDVDSCENPSGRKERRVGTVTADAGGTLVVTQHRVACR